MAARPGRVPMPSARLAAVMPIRALILLTALAAGAAGAADGVKLCLNWAPGADHAPLYYAREQGWFADADIALDIRAGGGSGDALAKLGTGECDAAIADFSALIAARVAGSDPVAVMNIFADSPLAFYSLDTAPIDTPQALAGKRIAAYATDPPKRLWAAYARTASMDAGSVTWVDRPNNAKVAALDHGDVDVAANGFYHHHAEYVAAFGSHLRVLWWRDIGINPYGNVLAVTARSMRTATSIVERLVTVVQRGYAVCGNPAMPCLDALVAANSHLDTAREGAKWAAAVPLLYPASAASATFGVFDRTRVEADLSRAGVADPPLANAVFTNRFLDGAVMPSR